MTLTSEVMLYPLLFATAMLISVVGTSLFRRIALRTLKFVQYPKSISIDTHVKPTPVGGGLAIYLGILGALFLTWPWSGLEQRILLAGGVLVLFGLADDGKALTVPIKSLGQFLAAAILLAPGFDGQLPVPQWFSYPLLNQAIALVWIIGVINAVNFLDIMDGLAAGTTAIAAIGFFCLAILITGEEPIFAALTIILAGGTLGFLVYNFEPASIFMGDTGSQFLGMFLGMLALLTISLPPSLVTILPPIVLLGVPLFEIAFTVTIRTLTGKAPWKGSKDHCPLRLFRLGFSVRQIVLTTYIVGLGFIPCAIWLAYADMPGKVLVSIFLIMSAIGTGLWLSQVEVPKISPPVESITPSTTEQPVKLGVVEGSTLWAEE